MFDSANKIIAAQLAPKIQKMFLKGLQNFADSKGVSSERIQLMLKISEPEKGVDSIEYTYCIDWKAEQKTDIKSALDIGRVDILGIGNIVPLAVGSVMQENAQVLNCPIDEMTFFLYNVEGEKTIGVVILHGIITKRICPIGELFVTED